MTRHNPTATEKTAAMTRFFDSLGYMHDVPLLKSAHATFPPDPNQGQFRLLVDELRALRDRRRRVTRKVKVPTNTRDRPAEKEAERISRADHIRPTPPPLKKSLSSLAAEAKRMTAESQRATAEIQRRTAIQMLGDLTAAAKAGRLGAIAAAKVDALRHANATALGLTATGVRR